MSAWDERQGQVRRLPGRPAHGLSPQTAVVEVLTARVRVLQVGSRQVTLSVYRQLDHVDPGQIEPFGRVKDRDDQAGMIHVVGSSTRPVDHGALVRSKVLSAEMLEHLREHDAVSRDPYWRAQLADPYRYRQIAQAAAAWERLPLIILAGLR
jgi:hypothetical protein